MNNSNDSTSFIAVNKLKHQAYNMCASQVDLKLTDFTLLDAHTLPTHGTAWRGVCGLLSMCVCHIITRDKNRTVVKVFFPSASITYILIGIILIHKHVKYENEYFE